MSATIYLHQEAQQTFSDTTTVGSLKESIAARAANIEVGGRIQNKGSGALRHQETPATTVQDIHANSFELLFHQIGIFMRDAGQLFQGFFRKINNSLLTVKITDTRSAVISAAEGSNATKDSQ